ncbi:hypothetical protein TNCV_4462081 [Trichonephila clavipes]|nr:hypothetical protein TNCV_4462081 [Trichonephila clavipes]
MNFCTICNSLLCCLHRIYFTKQNAIPNQHYNDKLFLLSSLAVRCFLVFHFGTHIHDHDSDTNNRNRIYPQQEQLWTDSDSPLPAPSPSPSELGGEEWKRKVESESNPKVALAAQSYPHAHACPNHVDIHLGTYNPTRCPPKAPDITQNVFKTGHSFVRFTQILLTGLT